MGLELDYIEGQIPLSHIISHVFGKDVFTWSGASMNKKSDARNNYLKTIRQADKGEIDPLIEFAKM